MKHNSLVKIFVILFISLFITLVNTLHDSRDLVITSKEKTILDEFRSQILSSLKETFMKSEAYLVRWLKRAKFSIPRAKDSIFKTIDWRQKSKIANITSEEWSDLELDYPMSFEGFDKEGRPLLFIDLGDWDLRGAVLQGKSRRLQRYLTYSTENLAKNVIKSQGNGKHVTRGIVVVDADGVNLVQHGCPLCLMFLVNWAYDMETHYPILSDETIIINVPSIGPIILNAIKAVATADLREQLLSFGSNKKQWMDYLDKRIDRDQRTYRYGGTKPINLQRIYN